MFDKEKLKILLSKILDNSLHKDKYVGMPIVTSCYPIDENGRFITDKWSDAAIISAYHGNLSSA